MNPAHTEASTEDESTQALRRGMAQADGIMQLEGFGPTPGMQALDAAMLAGRASLEDVAAFLVLHARITGAESVLQAIGEADPRYEAVRQRRIEHLEQLRAMAIRMDGAVRVAFGL